MYRKVYMCIFTLLSFMFWWLIKCPPGLDRSGARVGGRVSCRNFREGLAATDGAQGKIEAACDRCFRDWDVSEVHSNAVWDGARFCGNLIFCFRLDAVRVNSVMFPIVHKRGPANTFEDVPDKALRQSALINPIFSPVRAVGWNLSPFDSNSGGALFCGAGLSVVNLALWSFAEFRTCCRAQTWWPPLLFFLEREPHGSVCSFTVWLIVSVCLYMYVYVYLHDGIDKYMRMGKDSRVSKWMDKQIEYIYKYLYMCV